MYRQGCLIALMQGKAQEVVVVRPLAVPSSGMAHAFLLMARSRVRGGKDLITSTPAVKAEAASNVS